MSLAVDAVSQGNFNVGITSSITWSHTCSGANRVLIVGAQIGSATDNATCTYNGTSMTKYVFFGGGTIQVVLFSLVAPDTGTHDIVLSRTGNAYIGGGAVSFTGADQTTPLENSNSASATTSSPTVDITCSAGQYIIDTVIKVSGSGTPTSGQGTNAEAQLSASNLSGGCHYIAYSATPQTMSWSCGGSANNSRILGAAVRVASAVATNYAPMMMVSD
jgi:hypothetical protein